MNFVEDLKWRGMLNDIMPGTEELLTKEIVTGYVGFDPTADSLHIGNLVPIMLLVHFQRAGHKPMALVGGATGMVGDPSGKKSERKLLDEEQLQHNLTCQKQQLEKFLDFDAKENPATIVNNYDWFKGIGFLEFIRDTGKHITINYMMAKDSVKNRMDAGLSFTEFSYQLVQGYDFYHLYKTKGVKLQMGGSDQWGNITTGTELIRRMAGGEAFALTVPLLTKADGSKFGKSEGGNIWLDAEKTSPYKFYQYWLNISDDDAQKTIRIFSLKSREEIEAIESAHKEAPHQRLLQNALAEELTERIHSRSALENAIKASSILFGKDGAASLQSVNAQTIAEVFDGVPSSTVSLSELEAGIPMMDVFCNATGFLASNGEVRRAFKENSLKVNKQSVKDTDVLDASALLDHKYVVLQRGKKNYFLLEVA